MFICILISHLFLLHTFPDDIMENFPHQIVS